MMSLGGALGGVFVALVAPHIFSGYWELPLGIGACAIVALFVLYRDGSRGWWYDWQWLTAAVLTVGTRRLPGPRRAGVHSTASR